MPVFDVGRHGEGYAIFDGDGARISGVFSSQFVAEHSVDHRLFQLKKKTRDCICCGQKFQSLGNQNRMCDACRDRAAEADYQLLISF